MLRSVDTCYHGDSVPAGEHCGVCYCLTSERGRERGVGAPSRMRRKRRRLLQARGGIIRQKIKESGRAARNRGGRIARAETTKHENRKNSYNGEIGSSPRIERQRHARNTSEPAIDEETDEKESLARPNEIVGEAERLHD